MYWSKFGGFKKVITGNQVSFWLLFNATAATTILTVTKIVNENLRRYSNTSPCVTARVLICLYNRAKYSTFWKTCYTNFSLFNSFYNEKSYTNFSLMMKEQKIAKLWNEFGPWWQQNGMKDWFPFLTSMVVSEKSPNWAYCSSRQPYPKKDYTIYNIKRSNFCNLSHNPLVLKLQGGFTKFNMLRYILVLCITSVNRSIYERNILCLNQRKIMEVLYIT